MKIKNTARMMSAAPALFIALRDLVKCIRKGELGDYSPLMDEIFDAEAALAIAAKPKPRKRAKTLCEVFAVKGEL